MLPIPDEILKPFDAIMTQKAIPLALHSDYRKWLRYYLDFRVKYPPPESRSDQVRAFIDKLQSKGQSQNQLEQAAHALSILFEVQSGKWRKEDVFAAPLKSITLSATPLNGAKSVIATSLAIQKKPLQQTGRRYNEMRFREKTRSSE